MRTRNPIAGRNRIPMEASPVEAVVLRQVEVAASEYTAEEGAHEQSTNYDGTDVVAADATAGWRIEAEGDAEFQNARVRGDLLADRILTEAYLLQDWDFEVDVDGWTAVGSETVTRTTSSPISGTGSLLVTSATSVSVKSPQFAVEAGRFYAVTLLGKPYSESGVSSRFETFKFYTSGGTPIASTWSTGIPEGIDATYAEGDDVGVYARRMTYAKAPPTAALARIQVESVTVSEKYDDVQVWEVGALAGAIVETSPLTGAPGIRVATDIKFLNHYSLPDALPRLGPQFAYSSLGYPWAGQGVELTSGEAASEEATRLLLLNATPAGRTLAVQSDFIYLKTTSLNLGSSNAAIARDVLGTWETYTPTINTMSGYGTSVRTGRSMRIGRTIHFQIVFTWVGAFTFGNANEMKILLPFSAITTMEQHVSMWRSIAGVVALGYGYIQAGTDATQAILKRGDGTSITGTGVVANDTVRLWGSYEAANE